jgi:hypothetical protein
VRIENWRLRTLTNKWLWRASVWGRRLRRGGCLGVRMGFRPHAGLAAGFCRGNTVEPNNGLSNAWTIAKIKTLNVDC